MMLLIIVVCVAALAWWLNDPLPPNFSQPWKLRFVHGVYKIIFSIIGQLDKFGLIKEEDTIRKMVKVQKAKFPDGVSVTDEMFDGIPVRIYRHEGITQDQPGIVFFHGGGWVFMAPKHYDLFLVNVMTELKVVVVSVDYRLAPEHVFPAAFDDCLKATKHFFKNVKKLGVDPNRVALSGDSAGGNLAAAVSQKLRDYRFSPMPAKQILIYPVLQGVDLGLPSYIQNSNGFLLSRAMMAGFISNYAIGSRKYQELIAQNLHVTKEEKEGIQSKINHRDLSSNFLYAPYVSQDLKPGIPDAWKELQSAISSPYFSPLLADDLSGLPETFVFSSQYDVLRDESLLYVKRLREAGVKVTHVHAKNGVHGACNLKRLFHVEGQEWVSSILSFFKTL